MVICLNNNNGLYEHLKIGNIYDLKYVNLGVGGEHYIHKIYGNTHYYWKEYFKELTIHRKEILDEILR